MKGKVKGKGKERVKEKGKPGQDESLMPFNISETDSLDNYVMELKAKSCTLYVTDHKSQGPVLCGVYQH